MAIFVSYSDESAVPDPCGEFLVGGYVASEEDWAWFAQAWQERVLDGPPEIPYLHMTEMRSRAWRERYGISQIEGDDRVAEAIRVIRSSGGLSAFSSIISRSHFRDIMQVQLRSAQIRISTGIDEPDYMCFLAFAVMLLGYLCRTHLNVERVDFVVSQKGRVSNHLKTFSSEMKRIIPTLPDVDPSVANLVGILLPFPMEARLALQAADVICWHIQRYYASGRDGRRMSRIDEQRVAFLGETNGQIHEWSVGELELFVKNTLRELGLGSL